MNTANLRLNNEGAMPVSNGQSVDYENSPYFTLAVCSAVFVSLLALVVAARKMSSRKAPSPPSPPSPDTAAQPKRSKKVRSISVSVDFDGQPPLDLGLGKLVPYNLRSLDHRYRAVSECVTGLPPPQSALPPPQSITPQPPLFPPTPYRFPFQRLPQDCKRKIFSFLTHLERGIAGQVCRDWYSLVREASLWSVVDLTAFPACTATAATGPHDTDDCLRYCYPLWRFRVQSYMDFLVTVRPVIRRFRVALDIGDHEDGWLDRLTRLVKASRLQELEYLHLNWKETEAKPFWDANLTWTSSDTRDLMYKHRYRQRPFLQLFDHITCSATKLRKLILPFDWSDRSLRAFKRLTELQYLVLEKYFIFQPLSQAHMDDLFTAAPKLRELILEVWTPTPKGLQNFVLRSAQLQHLDLSQCRGIYPCEMNLPSLLSLKMNRSPWSGPLVSPDAGTTPCMYQVLYEGCPNLRLLNEHTLHPNWRDLIYPELQVVLNHICSCRTHKSGWM